MKKRFRDLYTLKDFTADIVMINGQRCYLAPLWVKSDPSYWKELTNDIAKPYEQPKPFVTTTVTAAKNINR